MNDTIAENEIMMIMMMNNTIVGEEIEKEGFLITCLILIKIVDTKDSVKVCL
jgi:hypothetical protein